MAEQEGMSDSKEDTNTTIFPTSIITVGDYSFDIAVIAGNIEVDSDNDSKQSQLQSISSQSSIATDSNNPSCLQIIATETRSKDVFELTLDSKTLQTMNWPNNSVLSVKQFISSVLFAPDPDMSYRIGFIDNDVSITNNNSNKNSNNNNSDHYNKLSDKYSGQEGDMMVITIKFANKWFNQQWVLKLAYKKQDEIERLHSIIKDLRSELQSVKESLDEFKGTTINDFCGELQSVKKSLNEFKVTTRNGLRSVEDRLNTFKGTIVMWSGQVTEIPKGWALCDGYNETPDLSDRFVKGSNMKYCRNRNYANIESISTVGKSGGTETHTHNIDVLGHALTVAEMPSHTHELEYGNQVVKSPNDSNYYEVEGSGKKRITTSTGGNQAHRHGSTCSTQSNLPPYYALAFIIKL